MKLKALVAALLVAPMMVFANSTININTADSEALVNGLTGIGPQKAMAIVRYRQANGPFQQVNDLAQVTGIGESTVEQNRARITVEVPKAQP